jgi:hypothetical protein
MSPKQKANELYFKFYALDSLTCEVDGGTAETTAKQCAIIAVDEIINALPSFDMVDIIERDYWQEVKKEIELL